MNKIFFLFILICGTLRLNASSGGPPFMKYLDDPWVESKLQELTLEEKISQLMMIAVYPSKYEETGSRISDEISKWKPGGILVMQGTPVKTVNVINQLQQKSSVPVLVAMDAEWGPAMRTDSLIVFPYAQAAGAVQDSFWLRQMGREIGNQLRQMGIHVNFAPVADINTNPGNPVIHFRSFGENRNAVSRTAWHIASGMQETGVLAVAKHFPGHGDTHTDSHLTLPMLPHSKTRMDTLETFPFRYLAEKGIGGVMTAHLNVPALDNSGTPSSLSEKIIEGYLIREIGFKGLIITDALNMKGAVTGNGDPSVQALRAGNDMVEFVPDLGKAILAVKTAIEKGTLTKEQINDKCRKILAVKRWANLHDYHPASLQNLTGRLNSPYTGVAVRKVIQGSLTVLRNDGVLPVQGADTLKVATVMIGSDTITPFQKMIRKYLYADHYLLSREAGEEDLKRLQLQLKNYNLVIAGIQGIRLYPANSFGISGIQIRAAEKIAENNRTVFAFFGNAYALKHFNTLHKAEGLIMAYQNNTLVQEITAQLIFGAVGSTGKLPVTIDERFRYSDGISLNKNGSLAYTLPEEAGMNSEQLNKKIDSLALLGIEKGAFPGCQVLFAKDGKIVFHKCYGKHTYANDSQAVTPDNLYDWASITKVAGPLPMIMNLTEEKKIDLDAPFGSCYSRVKGTNKEQITLRDILTHQSGLVAWIPFWTMALNKKHELDRKVFSKYPDEKYAVRVSGNLYMNRDFTKNIIDTICSSELKPVKKYVYSDLGFHLFPGMITEKTGIPYEKQLYDFLFKPLGLYTCMYNPYKHIPADLIVPTENDDFFRMESLQGFVHDEGAAMLGGISGNAGLFGKAEDLAKIFQMYLQLGYYGGKRYFREETIREFTRVQFPGLNRRALGFDKPLPDNQKKKLSDAYPAVSASPSSFGHSGFTGTFVWADPENQLLYIFLSNRVYPTRDNSRLYELNIRTAMHQAAYECLAKQQ